MSRDIKLLHPELQAIIEKFLAECRKQGLQVLIYDAVRTVAEQEIHYSQGRTTPGKIITSAKGSLYQSGHQWGVAFDFCRKQTPYNSLYLTLKNRAVKTWRGKLM